MGVLVVAGVALDPAVHRPPRPKLCRRTPIMLRYNDRYGRALRHNNRAQEQRMGMHGAWGWGGGGSSEEINRPREHVTLGRVIALFKPYRWLVLLILAAIVVGAILGVVPALLIQAILADLLHQHDPWLLTWLFVATLVVAIVGGLVSVVQSYLNTVIGQHVMADLRRDVYAHVQQLSLRWYTATRIGDIMSRFNNDIGGIQNIVTSTYVTIVSNILTVVVTLVTMFVLNWQLTIVSIIIIPIFVIPTRQVGALRKRISRATQEKFSEMSAFLQETLSISGAILVKSFVRQKYEADRFETINVDLRQLQIRAALIGRWFFMSILLFSTLGPALIYWLGGLEALSVIPGGVGVPTIVAFVALLSRLYTPAGSLMNVWVDVQTSAALFDRIFEYLDLPIDVASRPDAITLPQALGRIEFDHVSFSYVPSRLALDDVSFTIEPGQLAALVGPSGAGKTTITYLVPRFYDPDAGSVRLDGLDVRSLDLRSLGDQIGIVTQETYLFHTTIRENIAYGRPEVSIDEVIAAAKAAYIHDFIQGLPDGYDTVVGERGYKLSGGEKQRVAIARVVLKDPRILILDEATSSLDSQSEALIQAALEPLMRDRTSLVIAHRLSTILSADVILVVEGGRVVERGTHAELLARGGLYATLYQEQFKAEAQRLGKVG
jgi:ATP-binding cassette, subfamily B, bacterial